ncbi:MAG: hypothetical protein AAFY15_08040, partial [Cyanobacteria bacterium J06648_11]
MQVADLVSTLSDRGVQLWADRDKLKVNAPKGVLTSQLLQELATRKTEVLSFLRQPAGCALTEAGLSADTLGRLIGGAGRGDRAFKSPVIAAERMARQLKVTFRPLPAGFANEVVREFRDELEQELADCGVRIVPWEDATREIEFKGVWGRYARCVVKSDIQAVVDVDRPVNRHKRCLAEHVYRLYSRFVAKGERPAVTRISQLTGWAEDRAMHRLEDPTATQVISLVPLDREFVDADKPYEQKISLGVETLVSRFSEMAIGVARDRLSIVNMNLSDSVFDRAQLGRFVAKSLIPKIYVPIAPLPLSQFEIGEYDPTQSDAASQLVELSRALGSTGLFPSGFKLGEAIARQSHRDIVTELVSGRTGVSYGFVAYVEPPTYVGAIDISAAEWDALVPVDGYDEFELRQNDLGRQYVQTTIGGEAMYRQIPDVWLTCSRSGANKTDLNLTRDILRLGLTGQLQLQLPVGADAKADIKPSYDTYVMVAIALAAALYAPELVRNGAPVIHFHGYANRDWFAEGEAYAGVDRPSVPCGT